LAQGGTKPWQSSYPGQVPAQEVFVLMVSEAGRFLTRKRLRKLRPRFLRIDLLLFGGFIVHFELVKFKLSTDDLGFNSGLE